MSAQKYISPPDLKKLADSLPEVMGRDRHRLMQALKRLHELARSKKPIDDAYDKLNAQIEQSLAIHATRLARLPQPIYPPELPVTERRVAIAEAISAHQVVIICGETGSGKTTQLPKICLELKRGVGGMIGHTQPRRIAARSVAARIAEELNSPLGDAVGYKVRFNDKLGPQTFVKLMTDGILLAESQNDPYLSEYDTIIIDEAHERSLNIDFLLGFIKQLLPRRPDLKLIITSATIDASRFSKHFNDAPVIEVSGRTYPVEICYRPVNDGEDEDKRDLEQGILDAVDELARLGPDGDILVFLPGEREIRETTEALRKHHPVHSEILPLYARLSNAEQEQVFKLGGARRIVLATNVAETSLTVPGIRYVIDTGLARLSRYSIRNKVQLLQIEKISQASAAQRAGRCGRVADGVCIRLYSEEDFMVRPAYTEPEILRSSLASVILRMKALKLGEVEDFPFVEAPAPRMISDGYLLLAELGAVDEERRLTEIGQQLAKLPIDPRVARMILAAKQENCLAEVLIIAAALSVQDPRDRPTDKQAAADEAHKKFRDDRSDFLAYLKLWTFFDEAVKHKKSNRKLRQDCLQNFLSLTRMREWYDVHTQLHTVVAEMGWRLNQAPGSFEEIHRALLTGLLGNIGNKAEDADQYLGARGIKFSIFPGSALFKKGGKWLMAGELAETTRLYARCVAKIEPEWIERVAGHLIKRSYYDPHWEKKPAQAVAFERVSLYGIIINPKRRVHYGLINPIEAREIFIRGALVEGEYETRAAFFQHNQQLVEEIEEIEHKSRRQDVLVDEHQIYTFYDSRIPSDIHNGAAFERWRKDAEQSQPKTLFMSREDLMRHGADAITEEQFPEWFEINGTRFSLSYHFSPGSDDDGVTIAIPLPILNQMVPGRFDWLVPGLLREKMTALIKGLPQSLRRAFIPVPVYVDMCLEALQPGEVSLSLAMGNLLQQKMGIAIPSDAWPDESLRVHLMMNFNIIDESGEVLAAGRNLGELQQQLGVQAAKSFGQDSEWQRSGVTAWDFGELPEQIIFTQHGQKIIGYPGVVDQQPSVALELFDTLDKATTQTRIGLCRLFWLSLPSQTKYLEKNLPGFRDMALEYASIGAADELRNQLMRIIAETALFKDGEIFRNKEIFEERIEAAKPRLQLIAAEWCKCLSEVLALFHRIRIQLDKLKTPALSAAVKDIREQLDFLIYPGFILATPSTQLQHFPRYLKAIVIRLEKLHNAFARDAQLLAEFSPLWKIWLERYERDATAESNPAFNEYRWMLEELRVSLFAQELKTPFPISAKRLLKQWALV